jgi:hypothetical protein
VGVQSRNISNPGAQDFILSEGSSVVRVRKVERAAQPAGCLTTARAQEDGPDIWETLSVPQASESSAGRFKRGKPEREPMQRRESEGRI